MSHLSMSLRIAAPRAEIFDLIADPARNPEWQTLLVEMGAIAGRPGGIGSSFIGYYRVAGRKLAARFVVTAAERPSLLQLNGATTGGWTRWTTVIEAIDEQSSEVRIDLEYELPGEIVGSLFGLLTGNRLEREFRRTYEGLRRVAEERSRVPASSATDAPGDAGLSRGLIGERTSILEPFRGRHAESDDDEQLAAG
jgi:hypothetical protein